MLLGSVSRMGLPVAEEEAGAKSRKSFWHALRAIDAAWHLSEAIKGEGWRACYFNGIPRLSFLPS